jgi:hypothetical protein
MPVVVGLPQEGAAVEGGPAPPRLRLDVKDGGRCSTAVTRLASTVAPPRASVVVTAVARLTSTVRTEAATRTEADGGGDPDRGSDPDGGADRGGDGDRGGDPNGGGDLDGDASV